ncbi:MAG: AAA family ATPase [Lachnospiraceae bacterium]|nr:AAA family ATPase [Lachnospiraceae bacterium]
MGIKIIQTGDWHIGSFKGPERDGVNLRSLDTQKCLEEMVHVAATVKPELALVSGDVFDRAEIWQGRSHKEVLQARNIILGLSKCCGKVIVMRGTPNHDSAEAFGELQAHFELVPNVEIVTVPRVIKTKQFDIAILPGFDRGYFRANHPGLGKEEEHEVLTKELASAVLGLKAQCEPGKKSILMSHYTIPGCNAESGQVMMLTKFEPVLLPECLIAADFDLVAMGHIHRPQKLPNVENCYYSGAINSMTFNDEGQERGFWIHEYSPDGWSRTFHQTPYREFVTFHFTDMDITAINLGNLDDVAFNWWRYNGGVQDRIVRILYTCSYENSKALNTALLEKALYEDGAFYVAGILPEKVEEAADRNDLSNTTDPEENLRQYLCDKQYTEEQIQELILKARPVIAQAEASMSLSAGTGTFEPVEIEVRNYRNYAEEHFSFEDISFCTINGQNGAGKSSLFMDAVIDCLYEEPREGELTGWIRNDEKARSGSIIFTFRIGDKVFRVTRTRARSGKGTLNLSELVDGEWRNRSKEKQRDTQAEIINILGMDSLTFKSCALIMQDQYGLFLQAQKEDRMVILGNLLGLGVYEAMNKIAWDKAKAFGAKTRELKQEIGIHNATIKNYGDPAREMEQAKADLQAKAEKSREITKERDARKLELLSLREAQERCDKLSESIASLTVKKAATGQNRGAQSEIIRNCQAVLDTEQAVMEKAERYRALEARKSELIEKAALFGSKQLEVSKSITRVSDLESELATAKAKLQEEQARLAEHEDTFGDAEILRNAEKYQDAKSSLDGMQALALKHQEADQRVQAAKAAQREIEREIEANNDRIISTRNFLGKDIAILSDDCRCIDIEKADCKFLAKAKASKGMLQEVEKEYRAKKAELEHILAQRISSVAEAESERDSIPYDAGRKAEAERLCSELLPYVAKAEQVRKKVSEIALVRASVENARSNISDIEKRLAEANVEASRAKEELEQYRGAFDENKQVSDEMQMLSPWIEQEKQLPVIQERLANATQRLSELDLQITELDTELSEKQLELSKEILKTTDLAGKQAEVGHLDTQLEGIEEEIKLLQMNVGALTQKMGQIGKLKAEIDVLQGKERDAAKETADYDILKAAFSQDGIPHQIIRTIVPKLTATANTILGQMTGGKMGIDFKTEKVMKSNSKKEVVTLDIFIEEYGKPALPYLSKSGGEKVKASLSVILALAEIKSSTAGIQLGMLFIDEAPFLDSEGVQAYVDALETIQQRYVGIKVMAITHDPTFKARFPQSITVMKDNQGSHVRWD